MTTAQQRITLDDPMELLVLPVAAGEESEPDDRADDDEKGQRP